MKKEQILLIWKEKFNYRFFIFEKNKNNNKSLTRVNNCYLEMENLNEEQKRLLQDLNIHIKSEMCGYFEYTNNDLILLFTYYNIVDFVKCGVSE